MPYAIISRIYEIFQQVETEEAYRTIWEAYGKSHQALLDLMDILPAAQSDIIDDYMWAFFDMHMQMMEIARSDPQAH